ncbi:MAG: PLD nuclease N-terminal domain-containing protein [Desulfovibrio sp.]|nr:PLD nuclease N-terminal domain-containing protein [Desulfovibrio sp.]
MHPLLFYGLLALPALINLFGIAHAFRRVFPSPQERLLWLGCCVFVPVVGGLAYLVFGMRRAAKPAAGHAAGQTVGQTGGTRA